MREQFVPSLLYFLVDRRSYLLSRIPIPATLGALYLSLGPACVQYTVGPSGTRPFKFFRTLPDFGGQVYPSLLFMVLLVDLC